MVHLSFSQRIVLGFMAMMTIFALALFKMGQTLDGQRALFLQAANVHFQHIRAANRAVSHLLGMAQAEKNILLSSDANMVEQFVSESAAESAGLANELRNIRALAERDGIQALDRFEEQFLRYQESQKQVIALKRRGDAESYTKALQISRGVLRDQFDQAEERLYALIHQESSSIDQSIEEADLDISDAKRAAYALFAGSGLLAALIVYFLLRVLRRRMQKLVDDAQRIAVGDLALIERSGARDELEVLENALMNIQHSFAEIMQLSQSMASGLYNMKLLPRSEKDSLVLSLNKMSETLFEVTQVAHAIAEGDMTIEVNPKSNEDLLGMALKKMMITLRHEMEANQANLWIQEGVVAMGQSVRGVQDRYELGTSVLEGLCRYLSLPVGILYLFDDQKSADEDDEALPSMLVGIASYATSGERALPRFALGESLVGQAALQRKMMVVDDLPEGYLAIGSGLGALNAKQLVLVPLCYEDVLIGMVELGGFSSIDQKGLKLLDQVDELIAIAFQSAFSRERLAEMLEESQVMTEEMQVQHEEMEQTNAELEEQTLALEHAQADLERHNEELRVAKQEITERAQQLAASSQYKSEFLANMSHELRTPLNSILLLSKMLAVGESGPLSDDQRMKIQVVYDAGSDLLQLINEVLDLAKIESGKMDLNIKPINVVEFSNQFKDLFDPQAHEKGIAFRVEVDEALPAVVKSDPDRVQQVLRNFISNAIKFTAQGEVSLHVGRLSLDEIDHAMAFNFSKDELRRRVDEFLAWRVVDTGIGIEAKKHALVFEAFQQADGSTSRNYGGTGLGLSISREIALLLEGEVALRSENGNGSCFTLILPIEPSLKLISSVAKQELSSRHSFVAFDRHDNDAIHHVSANMTTVSIEDDHGTMQGEDKVLLMIEDDHRFAEVLMEIARSHGFKVIHANSGTEGVRLANEHLPMMITLDVQLPVMDGWSVLRNLKKNSRTSHIPAHVITAVDEESFAYRLGAASYLRKPVSPEALHARFEFMHQHAEIKVRNLLVVEDNDVQRQAIVDLIGNSDVKSTAVATGGEALEMLRSGHFEVMVLDLKLPDMSGYELLQQVAEDSTLLHVPTIVYTGRDLSLDDERELRRYADSIVVKTAESPGRLLEETSIYLHRDRAKLPESKRKILSELNHVDPCLNGKTVLLVDDDIRNLFALSAIMEVKGMNVITASNGVEALEVIDEYVDIVLMDVMMPEMDGYESIRQIRAMAAFKQLPIIALTAKALGDDREHCIAAGASDYLAKPIDYDQLISLMRVWLSVHS
ncbi:MAG: response regulator [Zetaproteobacteria bacterium]|nr:response regulator [Zetaproteobacteria bacterium]